MNYNKSVGKNTVERSKGTAMIVYTKLWETLKARGISQYKLIRQYGISTGQLDRLRKNENVSTYTLDALCRILGCTLSDVATYVPDAPLEKEEK